MKVCNTHSTLSWTKNNYRVINSGICLILRFLNYNFSVYNIILLCFHFSFSFINKLTLNKFSKIFGSLNFFFLYIIHYGYNFLIKLILSYFSSSIFVFHYISIYTLSSSNQNDNTFRNIFL